MPITPLSLRTLYPWFAPDRLSFDQQSDFDQAIALLDIELQSQIDLFTPIFSTEIYGDFADLALSLMIAHIRRLADENCIRIATALKQIESKVNLSLDNVFLDCGCGGDFLSKTIFGQQLNQIKSESAIAFSMAVI